MFCSYYSDVKSTIAWLVRCVAPIVGLDVVVGFVLEVLMTLLDWCMVDKSLFLAYDGSTYAMPWWAIARQLPLREAWEDLFTSCHPNLSFHLQPRPRH